MRRFRTILAVAGAAAVAIGVSAGPAAASTLTPRAPHIMMGLIKSPTSSGWAAEPGSAPGDATAFTHVQASFVLPTVTCDQTPTGIAAFRVSLGPGGSDTHQSTEAQVYVRAKCMDGATPTYRTGYRLASAPPVPGLAPNPGDTLTLQVTEKASHYTLSVKDLTSGGSFGVAKKLCSACKNTSAEVTAGSPLGHPPAKFGTVQFGDIFVVGNDGIGGSLSTPNWTTAKLVQTGVIHTVSGPLHTFAHPVPHSAFADKWVG